MSEKSRRKELSSRQQSQIRAGVYRIVNTETGKALIGSTANLASIRNKLDFARSTNSPSALGWKLRDDFHHYGPDAFALEILDELDLKPEMTPADIKRELAVMEALYRDQAEPGTLY